ncbi:hypothetical protein QZH41_008169, partial [Actinostola sp. cb2023]
MCEYATDMDWERRTSDALKASKLYLKGDFKVHLDKAQDVPDHCMVYALTDKSDPDFKQNCTDHNHEDSCDHCEALTDTIVQIESRLNRCQFPSDDDRDEARYIIESAKLAIQSWKCHILRRDIENHSLTGLASEASHGTSLSSFDDLMTYFNGRDSSTSYSPAAKTA